MARITYDLTAEEKLFLIFRIENRVVESIKDGTYHHDSLFALGEAEKITLLSDPTSDPAFIEKHWSFIFEGFEMEKGDVCPYKELPIGTYYTPEDDRTGKSYFKIAEGFKSEAERLKRKRRWTPVPAKKPTPIGEELKHNMKILQLP